MNGLRGDPAQLPAMEAIETESGSNYWNQRVATHVKEMILRFSLATMMLVLVR